MVSDGGAVTRHDDSSSEKEAAAQRANAEYRLERAIAARAAEIELLWKRAVFFWGFIATAFIGFAASYQRDAGLSLLIACFGLTCSIAWTAANRGSKYWAENWEQKVHAAEKAVFTTAPLFSSQERVLRKGLLGGRRYSVSRLVIALSDYTVLVWFVIAGAQFLNTVAAPESWHWSEKTRAIACASVTLAYITYMLVAGRSEPASNADDD